jgi:hypothetical protein
MSDGWLDGLAATQPATLQLGEAFELAAVNVTFRQRPCENSAAWSGKSMPFAVA